MKTKCEIDGKVRKEKCSVTGCDNLYYAKGFCKKHYALNSRNGSPCQKKYLPRTKCSVWNCENYSGIKSSLCKFHRLRKYHGIILDRPKGSSGKLNHNWKGGVAEYKNHSLLKKRRIAVLARDGNICFKCGKWTNQVHHIDNSKDNHTMDNLVACCHPCNLKMAKTKTSKFIRLYGKVGSEIAQELNVSVTTVTILHKKGILQNLLRNPILFRKFELPPNEIM